MEEFILDKLPFFGQFIGIIVATILLATLTNYFFRRMIRRSTLIMRNDPTSYLFLRHALVGLVYMIGFSLAIYTLPGMKAIASSLLAGAGILAIAAGFASQHALSNIVSGMFIVIFKPFRINDRLKVQELSGVVEDITLRHTVIRDFENRRIIIPNAVISDEVLVNSDFGDGKICKWLDVRISYDSDIDNAKTIITELALAHPLLIDPRTPQEIVDEKPIVVVRVTDLGEYAVHLRLWAWAKDSSDAFTLGCDLFEQIKKRFDQEGVEIASPYSTLVYKKAGSDDKTKSDFDNKSASI